MSTMSVFQSFLTFHNMVIFQIINLKQISHSQSSISAPTVFGNEYTRLKVYNLYMGVCNVTSTVSTHTLLSLSELIISIHIQHCSYNNWLPSKYRLLLSSFKYACFYSIYVMFVLELIYHGK